MSAAAWPRRTTKPAGRQAWIGAAAAVASVWRRSKIGTSALPTDEAARKVVPIARDSLGTFGEHERLHAYWRRCNDRLGCSLPHILVMAKERPLSTNAMQER
jgi:hypothetical protein